MSINDKNRIKQIEQQKEKLLTERKKMILESKRKVKEIKEIENIDLNKELDQFKHLFTLPEKTTKKELNSYIEKELKNIIIRKKQNKESLTKLEIEESILKTINSIYEKSNNKDYISGYIEFIRYIENISKVQFGRKEYKKNLFRNQALKELNSRISNSNNLNETIREIFLNLSKH